MYTHHKTSDAAAECTTQSRDHSARDEATGHENLLSAARRGDRAARQRLYAHCLPILHSWARGRLPGQTHGINDSDDLVQIALLRALNRLDDFARGGYHGFLAYLRQIVLNEVRGELRKQRRRGENIEYDDTLPQDGDPVVEHMLVHERECAYARAMGKLNRRQQEHLSMRVEFGMTFREIAARVGGSVDGARMTVTRALRSVSEHLAVIAN